MKDALDRFLRAVGQRQDLVIVFFILAVTALMILPLPVWLMDVMIALNITIGMLFLMLAVYLKSPLEFSTLPSAILISTLVRIAITISTTRLILVQGDAGSIVQSFGEFVVGGNVIVGLVIFTIIAIAQFIVITKGSERVAEVAARFALDALPGKQMSIDGDLRSGDIDRNEARRRRSNLERESQYFGAMDGAMKFVKGDAIVSMIVIFVNLIGGLLIGTMVRGMDVSTAFKTYALLTVGDGLSAQIPALLVAISGGIVVTRVTTETSLNLGSDLAKELVSSAQSLGIVGAALVALAFVPGFPTLTFLGLAIVLGAGAVATYLSNKKALVTGAKPASATGGAAAGAGMANGQAGAATPLANQPPVGLSAAKPGDSFVIRLSKDLAEKLDMPTLRSQLATFATETSRRNGINIPVPSHATNASAPSGTIEFLVDGAPTWRGRCPPGKSLVIADDAVAELAAIPDTEPADVPGISGGVWVPATAARTLTSKGVRVLPSEVAIATIIQQLMGRWYSRAFGLQDADAWLNELAQRGYGSLVQLVRQAVPLVRVADALRHLLAEGIGISHANLVLEGLVELAPKVDDNQLLADHLRLHLSRPVSAGFADETRTISAYVVELDLEEILRQSTREGPAGVRLSLDYASAQRLTARLREAFEGNETRHPSAVLMTAFDTRRMLRQFAISKGLDIPVVAFEEVASDYSVLPLGSFTSLSLTSDEPIARPVTTVETQSGAIGAIAG